MNAKVSESPYFETFPHGETFKSTFHSVKKLYTTSIYKTPGCIYGIYSALVFGPLWVVKSDIHVDQEPLPGPPNPPTLDATMTDLELFRHHCMDLGDKWPEAGQDQNQLDSETDDFLSKLSFSCFMRGLAKKRAPSPHRCSSGSMCPGEADGCSPLPCALQTHADPAWMGTLGIEGASCRSSWESLSTKIQFSCFALL